MKKRVGNIHFSPEIIHDSTPEQLKAIFSNFYPYFIRNNSTEYIITGYSEHFREIEDLTQIPHYYMHFRSIRFEDQGKEGTTIVFERMEEIYDKD